MENWDNKTTEELLEVVCALKTKKEAKKFLRDLLTPQEIIEFSKRWQAARMLSESISYSAIEKKTGLSSTTIARVSRWLNKGMGGYKLMIQRLSNVHRHNRALARRK
ncbi:hypothetical protein IID24_05235 [Patescibacteria group bacterium]|nr:hypothetical protein [Patescibacteria group bacterium]